MIPLPYSHGRSTCYSDRLHDFPITNPACYKDVYVPFFVAFLFFSCKSVLCRGCSAFYESQLKQQVGDNLRVCVFNLQLVENSTNAFSVL